MSNKNEVIIDGVVYVPKGQEMTKVVEGMEYCIVRTYSAGVFAGYVQERNGDEVTLVNSRRLWKWAGAAFIVSAIPGGCIKTE